MSGLDVVAICEALIGQIKSGVANADSFTFSAFPSSVPRPAVEIWPDDGESYISYYETSGSEGLSDLSLVVRFYLSGANPESEWRTQARLTSTGTGHDSSVVAAIMSDRTLGGVVADVFAPGARWNPNEGVVEIPVAIQVNKIGGPV